MVDISGWDILQIPSICLYFRIRISAFYLLTFSNLINRRLTWITSTSLFCCEITLYHNKLYNTTKKYKTKKVSLLCLLCSLIRVEELSARARAGKLAWRSGEGEGMGKKLHKTKGNGVFKLEYFMMAYVSEGKICFFVCIYMRIFKYT
jgi:hypothetical protein